MKGYHHLTLETRLKLETLLDTGQRPTAIARYLSIHRSTLWRERRRNAPQPLYDARLAQGLACDRRTCASSRTRIDELRWTVVEDQLCQDWSPQQIAGDLRTIHGVAVSHENGLTSTSSTIMRAVERFTRTWPTGGPATVGSRTARDASPFPTAGPSTNARPVSPTDRGWATGKPIPSSAPGNRATSSRSPSAAAVSSCWAGWPTGAPIRWGG